MADVRRSTKADGEPIAAMWAAAFAADPVIRWFLPEDASYRSKAEALFRFVFDVRHEGGEVWVSGRSAAAAWTPPGGLRPIVPTVAERWEALAAELAPDEAARIDAYGDVLDPLLPREDHWYLGVIGTDPQRQGQGLGNAVARPVMDRAEVAGVPQSLETCVPANRDLYRRWGFEVTSEFSLADSLTVWVMVRSVAHHQPESSRQ